eukprot:scaffold1858_cov56-Attheya_sp.AAC.2
MTYDYWRRKQSLVGDRAMAWSEIHDVALVSGHRRALVIHERDQKCAEDVPYDEAEPLQQLQSHVVPDLDSGIAGTQFTKLYPV